MPTVVAASNSLLTVEEYFAFTGETLDENVEKSKYIAHINAASKAIEKYCQRFLCPAQSVDEIFDGDDSEDYYVDHRLIVGTPTLYYWDTDQWVELTAALYPRQIVAADGWIWFSEGNVFERGVRHKVTYTTGWAISDVPPDIKLACMTLVRRAILRAERMEGVSSESFGDTHVTYSLDKMPQNVVDLLMPYRKVHLA